MKKDLFDNLGLHGKLTFSNFLIEHPRAQEIDAHLQEAYNLDPAEYDALIRELASLCQMREMHTTNIVVLTGREVFARLLIGDDTYSGAINYGLLGTDNTAPASGDTTLGAEVKRKLFARRVRSNAQVTFDFYYSKLDTSGTYEEFGTVIDGTTTADTGVLYNRALTGGWTKTSSEAMTVQATFDINQA